MTSFCKPPYSESHARLQRANMCGRKLPTMMDESEVTVVIPCHNHGQFLPECLASLAGSTLLPCRVIVIDDASESPLGLGCYAAPGAAFPVELHRVDFRNVHAVRRFGLDLVETRFVLFLDADNCVHPYFLEDAVVKLKADRNAAFVFAALRCFGDVSPGGREFAANTDKAPELVTSADIELQNFCDGNAVFRTEVLRQSGAYLCDVPAECNSSDWRVARQVLRFGGFHALKSVVPLRYRVHAAQMSRRPVSSYFVDANLSNEGVTIIVLFSGRWGAWAYVLDWLRSQTWPAAQTSLVILNNSGQHLTAMDLGLGDYAGAQLSIECVTLGRPGLGDLNRQVLSVRHEVEAVVAGLYNRALHFGRNEFLLFLEDDVVPESPGAIGDLMGHIGPCVAAVSGAYEHRYHTGRAVAFSLPWKGVESLCRLRGASCEIVGGSGFGCLLARRSVLERHALSGDAPGAQHYDVEFSGHVKSDGLRWLLCRDVRCSHLTDQCAVVLNCNLQQTTQDDDL